MRPRKPTLPPISPAFAAKKDAILSSLAQPDDSYSDASPKGSVDDAIKELIDRLNTIDGVVTTSSCAGRVSVFAEGRRNRNNSILAAVVAPRQTKVNGMNHVDGAAQPGQASERDESDDKQRGVPGGKGLGGQWLFVSHEPLGNGMNGDEIAQMFGLPTKRAETNAFGSSVGSQRLVRFQFEPMVRSHRPSACLHNFPPFPKLMRACRSCMSCVHRYTTLSLSSQLRSMPASGRVEFNRSRTWMMQIRFPWWL